MPLTLRTNRSTHAVSRPLLYAASALSLVLPASAWAQSAQSATASASRSFAIPAQPLEAALREYMQHSGVQVGYESADVAGRTSAAVNGAFGPSEALSRLLSGTGLTYRFTAPTAVRLEPAPTADAGAVQLGPVRVEGDGGRTSRYASVTETAKGPVVGYVAKRSATATKTDTPLIESPQSIAVVAAEEIQDRNAQTLDEVLRFTAGVTPNQKPWSADLYSLVRGFELGATGIFLDGLLNPNNGYMATLEPYALERVEVLRGPGSVLFGQMAPGGMVNAVSKRPTADTVREIAVDYGSFDRKQLKADFGGAIDRDGIWTYRLTMLGRNADTRIAHDKDNRLYIAPSLSWRPTSRTSLTLLGLYQEDNQSYAWQNQIQNPGALGQPDPGVSIGGLNNRWKRKNKMIGYEFEHQFSPAWSFRQNLRYSDLSRSGTDVLLGALQADGRRVARTFSPRENMWESLYVDNQLQAKIATGPVEHTLLAGVDYNWSKLTFGRLYANVAMPLLDLFDPVYVKLDRVASANPYHDVLPSKQLGFYLQDQLKVGKLVVTGGLRHDSVDQSRRREFLNSGLVTRNYDYSPSATTGRVGAVYIFDSGWAPYVSFATSFAPEIGVDVNGDPLKPSRGRQIEAGLRYQPTDRDISLTASVFDLVRRNVTTGVPGSPGQFMQTGEVSSRGLELEARAEATQHISLIAQYTYLDTEITRSNNGDEGLRQRAAPRHSASAWTKYSFDAGGGNAFAALGLRYLGKARSAQDWGNLDIRNPSFFHVDAAAGFQSGAWRLSLNLSNIFDTQKLTDCDGALCYRSAPRTANLSASLNF